MGNSTRTSPGKDTTYFFLPEKIGIDTRGTECTLNTLFAPTSNHSVLVDPLYGDQYHAQCLELRRKIMIFPQTLPHSRREINDNKYQVRLRDNNDEV